MTLVTHCQDYQSSPIPFRVLWGHPQQCYSTVPSDAWETSAKDQTQSRTYPTPNLCNEGTQLFQGTLQMFLLNMIPSVLSTWACPCSLASICHFLIKSKPSSTEVPRALGAENYLNLKSSASSKRECVCYVVKQSRVCFLKKPGRTQCPRTLSNVMSLR